MATHATDEISYYDEPVIHRIHTSLQFLSYKVGKLRGTQHKSQNSAVKSSHLSRTGQYIKCVQC